MQPASHVALRELSAVLHAYAEQNGFTDIKPLIESFQLNEPGTRVSREGWQKVLSQINPAWSSNYVDTLYDKIDTSGDGKVSMAELRGLCWDTGDHINLELKTQRRMSEAISAKENLSEWRKERKMSVSQRTSVTMSTQLSALADRDKLAQWQKAEMAKLQASEMEVRQQQADVQMRRRKSSVQQRLRRGSMALAPALTQIQGRLMAQDATLTVVSLRGLDVGNDGAAALAAALKGNRIVHTVR
jgi:hypothetical protein